jgi:DNA-binding MarR family transcriptional regulator
MTKAKIPVPQRHRVAGHLARRFNQLCQGITAEVTERVGLRPVEWAIIAALEDVPDIEQGALATRVGIDPVSTHHLVNRLAAVGYVERRVSRTDRRARALRLTPRGQALRDRLRADVVASQQRILEPLKRQEAQIFLELLRRLVEAHEAYARPGNGRRRPPALAATTADQRSAP